MESKTTLVSSDANSASSSKHTPAPWMFDDDAGIYADGVSIAQVYGPDDFPCFTPETDEARKAVESECEANGHLISAAPELFEACKKVLLLRDWVVDAGGTEGALPEATIREFAKMQFAIHDFMEAAIAKAEGGRP